MLQYYQNFQKAGLDQNKLLSTELGKKFMNSYQLHTVNILKINLVFNIMYKYGYIYYIIYIVYSNYVVINRWGYRVWCVGVYSPPSQPLSIPKKN